MMSKEQVQNLLATSNKCFRELATIVGYWDQSQTDEVRDMLSDARPECGYDCDECCPYSGKAEQ